MNKLFIPLMAAAWILTGSLSAQTQISAGADMLADNNIFRNYADRGDVVVMPHATFGYNSRLTENDNLYFAYDGEFFLFDKLSYRDFSVHGFGADFSHFWPESRSLLSAGARFEGRVNPEDYSYYNYSSGGAYINLKRYLTDKMMMYAAYNLNGRSFSEFPEFNYAEQVASVRLNYSLPTRTTLGISGTFYYKDYTRPFSVMDSVFVEPGDQAGGNFPGMGMGRGRFTSPRMQEIFDRQFAEDPGGFYMYAPYEQEFPSTSQFVLGLTAAQNLAEGTGLMVGYYGRANPTSRNRYLANLGESVLNNEELFDDHYSYVGHEGKVQLKQVLPAESMLTLLVSARSRNYSGRPALDLEGFEVTSGDTRHDKAVLFSAMFTKSFSVGAYQWLDNFSLSLQGGVGRNDSNDAYYDYESGWFSMGLEKSF